MDDYTRARCRKGELMLYIIATTLVTIAVAVAAAFFSIYGLSQIFAGALVAVIIMGAALEAGKLLATLILHSYWDRLSKLLRVYLTAAVILLMVITSSGVYGFLSAAYQKEQIPLQQINAKIELLDSEYSRKTERLDQMDAIIAEINPDYITKRLEEKNQQKAERLELIDRINAIESEKQALTITKIDTEAHIGPIVYMAEVFDKTSNEAASYLIMLLIIVFDPLAVALTITISSMVKFRKEDLAAKAATHPTVDHEHPVQQSHSIIEEQPPLDINPVQEYTNIDTVDELNITYNEPTVHSVQVDLDQSKLDYICNRLDTIQEAQDEIEPVDIGQIVMDAISSMRQPPDPTPTPQDPRKALKQRVRENSSL